MKLILSDRNFDLAGTAHDDITWIDLSSLKIANCIGCFGCWTKTPGKCVLRDDAVKVYPLIAKSDTLLYVTRVRYGCFDTVMKTILERAIPIQQAFLRLSDGETHHVQREVALKDAVILAYGTIDEEEKRIFENLVERNSRNMNFRRHKVIFTEESQVEEIVKKEIAKWKK